MRIDPNSLRAEIKINVGKLVRGEGFQVSKYVKS